MSATKPVDKDWTRLVYFFSLEGKDQPKNRPRWGEPLGPDLDIGLALLQVPRPDIKVRQWSEEEVWHPDGHFTGEIMTIRKLMSPLVIKRAPISVELNYPDRAEELGVPIPRVPRVIIKSEHTFPGVFQVIEIPPIAQDKEMDYQVSLAIIIGRMCKNVREEEALDYVLGYTCANEFTARKVEQEYGSTYAKSFDRFGPVGPVIVNPRKVAPDEGIILQTRVNGELLQDGNTSNMIFSIPKIIAHVSNAHTLWPGTVILTGTPGGVGWSRSPKRWLRDGDEVHCFASGGMGTLRNVIKYQTAEEAGEVIQMVAPWNRLFPKDGTK